MSLLSVTRARLPALAAVALLAFAVPAAAQTRGGKAAPAPAKKKPDRPGDTQASTKGLEEALKKSEADTAQQRAAPAKLDSGKEVSRDALADQRRDEQIEYIMKVLPKQKAPETRAELLFRLAELWWEKSRYVYLAEEMPAYQAEREAWFKCQQEKGEKACPAEPRPNHRKSQVYRENAVNLYGQVIKEHPGYPRNDEVRFILAYNQYDLARSLEGKPREKAEDEALKQYRALITLHPKSPFVAEAYQQLGDHYFERNLLTQARKAFDECVKQQTPRTETYCVYKLAWCDINSGDHKSAVNRFKIVIARSKGSGSTEGDRIRLGAEALRDLIVPFSQIPEKEIPDAEKIRYFQEAAGTQGSRPYLIGLARVYFDAGKYEQAISMFRYMLGEHPHDPNAPEWQSKVVLAFDKLNQRDTVLKEMERLVDTYRPASPWAKVNATNKAAIEIALNLTEEALYNLVTDYHQEAIKTKTVKTYRLARDIYKKYIENFPASERAYQMRFYYAEILYALEDFANALEQYRLVALDKERDDYRRISAENMLLSAERILGMEQGKYERTITDDTTRIDEKKSKGTLERKQIVKVDKTSAPQELTAAEQQFIAACDQYVEIVPNAADEAKVRLAAAVIYFDRVQYVEAARRFGYIINKWPEEKSSGMAAQLILESLEVKEEWVALNQLSREFAQNKRLLAGKADFQKKVAVYIEGSQFKHAMEVYEEKKDFPAAAKLFREFVAEFGKSRYAPIALYNAFVIFQRAKELDTAIEVAEHLLRDYPTCDTDEWRTLPGGGEKRALLLPLLVFDLAKTYQQVADFPRAARFYERFAAEYPANPDAPNAQYNAAYWYQGLGEYEKALAAYDKYLKAYRARGEEDRRKLELPPEPAVFFEMALIHEAAKEWKKAVDKYDEYLRVYRNEEGWKHQNARYRRFLALREQGGRQADVAAALEEIVKRHATLSPEERERETSRLAVAHARFLLLEPKFDAYRKIRFESPRTLEQDLKRKVEAMNALKRDYAEVVGYQNRDYTIAALVRLAALPREFAKSLLEAPVPKGFDDDQRELYLSILESKALEYEEPAIVALETALAKANELGIYNQWLLEAQTALAEFKPDAFGEARSLPLRSAEFFFTAGPESAAAAAGAP